MQSVVEVKTSQEVVNETEVQSKEEKTVSSEQVVNKEADLTTAQEQKDATEDTKVAIKPALESVDRPRTEEKIGEES